MPLLGITMPTNVALSTFLAVDLGSDSAHILRLLVDIGCDSVRASSGAILVFDESAGDLVFAMTVGEQPLGEELIGQHVPLGAGITGLAASTETVQYGPPTFAGVRHAPRDGEAAQPTSIIAAPMLRDGEMTGVITAATFEDRQFTSDDAMRFAKCSAAAGALVEKVQRLVTIGKLQAGESEGSDSDSPALRISRAAQRLSARYQNNLEGLAELLESLERLGSV